MKDDWCMRGSETGGDLLMAGLLGDQRWVATVRVQNDNEREDASGLV